MPTSETTPPNERYALTPTGRRMWAELTRESPKRGGLSSGALAVAERGILGALSYGPRTSIELRAAVAGPVGSGEQVVLGLERLVLRELVQRQPPGRAEIHPGSGRSHPRRGSGSTPSESAVIRRLPRSPTIQLLGGNERTRIILGERRIGSLRLREAIRPIGPPALSLDDLALERDRVDARALRREAAAGASKTIWRRHERALERWADDGGDTMSPQPELPRPGRVREEPQSPPPEVEEPRDPGFEPRPQPEVHPLEDPRPERER